MSAQLSLGRYAWPRPSFGVLGHAAASAFVHRLNRWVCNAVGPVSARTFVVVFVFPHAEGLVRLLAGPRHRPPGMVRHGVVAVLAALGEHGVVRVLELTAFAEDAGESDSAAAKNMKLENTVYKHGNPKQSATFLWSGEK